MLYILHSIVYYSLTRTQGTALAAISTSFVLLLFISIIIIIIIALWLHIFNSLVVFKDVQKHLSHVKEGSIPESSTRERLSDREESWRWRFQGKENLACVV